MNITIFHDDINGETIQTVNARELHEFLGVKSAFKDWIARRINDYEFEEGRDFCSFLSETPSGGRPRKEYHISLDMAKELSMVERNEKGREARQYFIECERRAKAAPVATLTGPQLMAAALIEADVTIKDQARQIESMKEDVAAHERIAKCDGSLNVTEAAKNLGLRPKDLFTWLSSNNWIYKRAGASAWLGYQTRCNAGDVEHKTTTVLRADGSEKITEQVRITAKGLAKLAKLVPGVARRVA